MPTPRTPRVASSGRVYTSASAPNTPSSQKMGAQSPKIRRLQASPPRTARTASQRLVPIAGRTPPKTARSARSSRSSGSCMSDLAFSEVGIRKTAVNEPVRHFDQGEERSELYERPPPSGKRGGTGGSSRGHNGRGGTGGSGREHVPPNASSQQQHHHHHHHADPDDPAHQAKLDKVHGIGLQLKKIFEQKSVRRMFRDWDQDFSGSLDTGEFVAALDKHGFKTSPEEVEMLMRYLDDDFDGNIRYNEFQHLMEERLENQKYKSAEVRYSLDRHRKPDTPVMRPPSTASPEASEAGEGDDEGLTCTVLPAGGKPRMPGGAFATAHPGQWRLPAQWAEQPFPEPLRKFQKMIRKYVDPRPSIRDVFREWDKDHDGFLDYKEFYDGLLAIDFSQLPPESEIKNIFTALDAADGNIDGKIDFNAFRLLTKPDIKDPQSTVRPRTGEINGLPVLPEDHYEHLKERNEPYYPLFNAKDAIQCLNDKFVDRKTSMEMYQMFNWNPNPLEVKEAMLAEDFRRGLAMLEIRLNDEEFEKMWKEVDADGSGELDYYEFLDAFYPTDTIEKVEAHEMETMDQDEAFEAAESGSKKPLVRKVMQRFGQKFSSNKKAFRDLKNPTMAALKSDELHSLLQTTTYGLTKEEADEVLRHADQSGDGYIDYAEFCNTMMPQERNRKGNPMELLNTTQSSFKAKRARATEEFTMNSVPFAQSFGAAATGGRYGLSFRNNRNFSNTFRNMIPDDSTAPNQFINERDRMRTTASSGLLAGHGGTKDHRTTLVARRYQNEDRIMGVLDAHDAHTEERKANRVKNTYNRRMLYVNTLHHDKRNAPRLACRFNHG